MKKFAVVMVFTLTMACAVSAQSATDSQKVTGTGALPGMLNLKTYTNHFLGGNGQIHNKYLSVTSDADFDKFSALEKQLDDIDTPLEIALLSYSAGVINIRPAEAAQMLPKNHESDVKVGALMYQNLQAAAFLKSSNAAAYATLFNQFCAENNVSKAEIKTYFNRNIRAHIAETVNEEFNKVSFMIDRNYNAVLTRNPQNGQFKLSYEGVGHVTKELPPANLLEVLSSAMDKSGDFSATAFNEVRAQADLIPAVVYAGWKAKGVARGVDGMALITETLTNFYTSPSKQTYEAVRGIYARYQYMTALGDPLANAANLAYKDILKTLNLINKVSADVPLNKAEAMARIPADQRFDVFSTQYDRAQR